MVESKSTALPLGYAPKRADHSELGLRLQRFVHDEACLIFWNYRPGRALLTDWSESRLLYAREAPELQQCF